jgi:GNAT superfamily N-acetyltransferase
MPGSVDDPSISAIGLRPAQEPDAARVADVWLASFRATYRFPPAHSDDEVRAWVRDELLPNTDTWVADLDRRVIGFLSLADGWVEQLYVDPDHTGAGIGSRLIELAKDRSPAGLQLWTFQANEGARRFYERHGFTVVELTDGAGNEEHQPDVRYAWK